MPASYLLVRVPEGAGHMEERVPKGHITNSYGSSVILKVGFLIQCILELETFLYFP